MAISVIRLWLDSYPWFSRPTQLWLDSFESESSQIWLTTHELSTTLLPPYGVQRSTDWATGPKNKQTNKHRNDWKRTPVKSPDGLKLVNPPWPVLDSTRFSFFISLRSSAFTSLSSRISRFTSVCCSLIFSSLCRISSSRSCLATMIDFSAADASAKTKRSDQVHAHSMLNIQKKSSPEVYQFVALRCRVKGRG